MATAQNFVCMPDREPLISAEQAGELFGMSAHTMRRLADKGKIPAVRIGSRWRFKASVLERWVEEQMKLGNVERID